MSYTPGPWAVRGGNSELPQVWDSGFDVCVTDRVFNGNAELIALAPQLVEALGLAIRWSREEPLNDAARAEKSRDVRRALVVFAKAKGLPYVE